MERWVPGTSGKLAFKNFLGDFCPHTLFLCLPAGDNPGGMGGHHVLRDGCTFFLQFYIFYIAHHSKYDLGDAPLPCPWGVKLFSGFFHRKEPRRIQDSGLCLPLALPVLVLSPGCVCAKKSKFFLLWHPQCARGSLISLGSPQTFEFHPNPLNNNNSHLSEVSHSYKQNVTHCGCWGLSPEAAIPYP